MDATQDLTSPPSNKKTLSALRRDVLPFLGIATIVVVAVALRFYGLDWDRGFPYTPHPDERAILFKVGDLKPPAISDLGLLLDADESPWNPRWFPYGSFPLYMLRGVQGLLALLPGDSIPDLRVPGRAVSAFADVVTVITVFFLASLIYDRRTGFLASALVAVSVIHIQLSHFFAVDTLLALFTVLGLFFMFRVAREGRLRDSVIAGVLVGLGLATKVSQAPIYAAFFMAHLMFLLSLNGNSESNTSTFEQRLPMALKALGVGFAVSLVVLFVAQPYAFLDWSRFFGDVTEQSEMVRRIRDYPYTRQYVDTLPYLYHIRQLATWGLGWPLGIVAWSGLIYASLRGLRLTYGMAYLAVGIGLPMAILLFSNSFIGILLASAIALIALIVTLPLRSEGTRMDVLMLSWVMPYFLITGAFQVKFMRYLIPITPFLVIFGSRMLIAIWDKVAAKRLSLKPLMIAGMVLLIWATGFYALSYTGVYNETHTAVRASEWINRNAPEGSLILKEHWDEGLPELHGYRIKELPLYNSDDENKTQLISELLADADYLVFFSNRLYGTIPRLPERYPVTTQYYNQLFSGELGYELVNVQATYPELLGVGFVDDTFDRPGVVEPLPLQDFRPSPITLNLGFADESFSVYDHPKILTFQNTDRLSVEAIKNKLPASKASNRTGVLLQRDEIGLLLSDDDAISQQQGGTWSEIVRADSWTNRYPLLAWLIAIEGIALLALPIAFLAFRPLADRGFMFSKALGLLLVSLIVWLLASLQWMAFSRASVSIALLAVALVSLFIIAKHRQELIDFVRQRWSILLIGEAIFLAAFLAFVVVRMANPDLWHPFRGGEKPMDFAYLNAVTRSTFMPPYDPWFGGGYINYYYWGQFIVATLIRITSIDSTVVFNLAVPLFFALTVAGAFGVVYNLAEGTRRVISRTSKSASPIFAGIVGAVFVTVLGNLDGAIQIGHGVKRALLLNEPFGGFDFWRSSRMMPPDPPGHEITEFPFFTFLFADLHAHMMVIPFTLLTLGIALAVVISASQRRGTDSWNLGGLARLVLLGVSIGALRLINTWDFPTYLIIGGVAIFIAEFITHGGLGFVVLVRTGAKSMLVFLVSIIAFLPFQLTYETFFNSVESTTNTTVLWQFLAISGLFIFIIGSFFVHESRSVLYKILGFLMQRTSWLVEAVSSDDAGASSSGRQISVWWVLGLVIGAVLIGFALTAALSGTVGSTVPFVLLLFVMVLFVGIRWLNSFHADMPYMAFVVAIIGMSLALVLGLDFVRVEGDIDRMNSVFKFYLQVWVMLALASAYLLWRFAHGRTIPLRKLPMSKKAWVGMLVALVVSAMVYPIFGTQDRLRDRFNDNVTPLTLSGTAYIEGTTYYDREGDVDLATDYEGIEWLKQNVQGSPIVLEGVTPTYRWGSRVAIYTGLPSVVGWQWHQEQQRWGYRDEVVRRISDVERIYETTNPAEAISLLKKYNVNYLYLGELEKLYFPGEGLEKFEQGPLSNFLEPVFRNDKVTIYKLVGLNS